MAKGDAGTVMTDMGLKRLENKIGRIYDGAKSDIEKTIDEYWNGYYTTDAKGRQIYHKGFYDRDEDMKQLLDAGEISTSEYKEWRLNQIGRGKRYEAMRDKLADRVYRANEVANAYVNDATPGIYSLNWNYSAYTIEKLHQGADMILYDEQTVKRLIRKNPNLMPEYPKERAIDRGIDLAYSKKVITNTITRHILTGKSLKSIKEELMSTIVGMSKTSALRAARTAFTGAQNGGRLACMESAQEKGIDVQKQWFSARDGRVRDSHLEANAQIKPIKKPFDVGGSKLMYPGDPSGPGREVYNCRCTLLYVVDGKSVLDPAMQKQNGSIEDFKAWEKQKPKATTPPITVVPPKPKVFTIGDKIAKKAPKPVANIIRRKVEYKNLTMDEFNKMAHKISKAERKILYGRGHSAGYINSSNAREINELMRYGKPLGTEFEEIKNTLEDVIKRSTINESVMAIRYVDDGKDMIHNLLGLDIPNPTLKLRGEEYKKTVLEILKTFKKGKIYQSNGFTSVSFVKDKNVMDYKGIKMNIKVPKGTKGYITTNKKESEVILPPKTKIRIDKVILDTDSIPWKYIIDCTVVE